MLQRPDWEQLADPPVARRLVAQLRKAAGPHSLVLSSYPEKVRKVESDPTQGLRSIGGAWVVLVLVAWPEGSSGRSGA